jgi:hypothetical protein
VLSPTIFGELCRLDGIDRVIVEPGANLHGHRNRDSSFDFFQDRFQPWVIFEEARSAAMLHNLRRGTATVYVQDVGANFFSHLSSHAHAFRLSAENLHGERPLVFIKAHLAFRFWIVARQAFDGNEFRNRQTDPTACLQQTAKRNVSNARHRREHQWRIDLDVANLEGLDLVHKKAT